MNKKFILIIVAVIALGCKHSSPKPEAINSDEKLIFQLKTDAVDTLIIDSNSFVLEAYLWCNSQAIDSENGKVIIAINRLVETDSVKVPDNINLVKQYVIYKDSLWVSDYESETRPDQSEYKLEKVSRNGPKWGPRITVDVISQVYDSNTKKKYYIKRKNIFVEQVD